MADPDVLPKATKVLVNVTGSAQFGMHDASEALHLIQREFDHEANLIIGTVRDDSVGDQVSVMVVASGFNQDGFELKSAAEEDSTTSDSSFFDEESDWPSELSEESLDEEQEESVSIVAEGASHGPAGLSSDAEREEFELPTNGMPLEFVPQPPIRVDESEPKAASAKKRGFFGRKSFFS